MSDKIIEASKDIVVSQQSYNSKDTDRGYIILNLTQLRNKSGHTASGGTYSGRVDTFRDILLPQDRNTIIMLFTPLFSIISNVAKMISSIKYSFQAEKHHIDRIEHELRKYYSINQDYNNYYEMTKDVKYLIQSLFLKKIMIDFLAEYGLLPDLSNFEKSMLFWKRDVQFYKIDHQRFINEWFEHPNEMDTQEEYIEKWIYDYMVHGATASYIDCNHNPWILAGGTVRQYYERTITELKRKGVGYVQILPVINRAFSYLHSEIDYTRFMPVSWRATGLNPVENLLTEIIEFGNFDQLATELSNKETPPSKMVLLLRKNEIGNIDEKDIVKILEETTEESQERLEEKLKEPVKGGIVTHRGDNVVVVDLSRTDYMIPGSQRQQELKKRFAMTFGLTSLDMNEMVEINRATSETEYNLMKARAVMPILSKFRNHINNVIRRKFGRFTLEIGSSGNEIDWGKINQIKQSGVTTVNEIRTQELNLMPLPQEEADQLPGTQPPGQNEANPFLIRNVK